MNALPQPRTGGPVEGRFAGKAAIVTGASRGIGLGIANRLVAEGADVAITARGREGLDEAVAAIEEATARYPGRGRVLSVAGKADDEAHRAEVLERLRAEAGPVDLLVNNAGINPVYGRLVDIDLGAARKIAEVNNVATLAWTQQAFHASLGERGGAVLNIASLAGLSPSAGIGYYGMTKAAVLRMTTELAVELGPGVRVNAVAPGIVKTNFATALYEGREADIAGELPLGRLGVPDDIAGPASFLLSDDAHWITGHCLTVDGGAFISGSGLA